MNGTGTGTEIRVKNRDRYGEANFISKFFWCWLEPLFITGCRKRQFNHEDLCDAPSYAKSEGIQKKLEMYWEQELDRRNHGRKPRLWVALLKLLYPRLLIFLILSIIETSVLLVQAILIGRLADYFVGDLTEEETRNALLYAAGIVICSILSSLIHPHAFVRGQEAGMLGRIALTGTIYKKIFALSLETIGETTIGRIINLASNDVQRIEAGFYQFPFIFIAPFHIVAVIVILWVYLDLGPSALAGVGLTMLLIPMLYLLGIFYAKLRFASAKRTDERVKVMNEIIAGIKVIKMYGWEYAFKKVISRIRRKESCLILSASLIRGVLFSIKLSINGVALSLMLAAFTISTGRPLTPSIVFTGLRLLSALRITAVIFLTDNILGLQETKVALRRIEELLVKDLPAVQKALKDTANTTLSYMKEPAEANHCTSGNTEEQPSITVEGLSAAWKSSTVLESESGSLTLKNISFSCNMNRRTLAVVGPVGAGKSSLLHCLLGELQPVSGSVDIRGSVGYSPQDSWVFSGTVKENILFGQEFEQNWYNEVLEECCLDEDMIELPFGDQTLVGERGVTLSGGQIARISLARAVYRKANVYILDDPLSAVDADVGQRLFKICTTGALRSSIVVLVTHHIKYAQLTDAMLVLDKGEALAHGTHDEIMNMINHSDENEAYSRLKDALSELLTTTQTDLDMEEEVFDLEAIGEDQELVTSPVPKALPLLHRRPEWSRSISTTSLMSPSSDGKYELTYRASVRSAISFTETENCEFGNVNVEDDTFLSNTVPLEDKAQGSVTMKTYIKYFKAGGGYIGCFLTLIVFLLGEASITVSDWWVSEWAASNGTCAMENSTFFLCDLSTELIALIYFGLASGSVLLSVMRGVLFLYVCIHASRVLHNRMFAAVLRTPARFFDINPIGRILNRFSKDLSFLDDLLPFFFFDYLTYTLRIASVVIIAGVANYYIFIPVVIMLGVFLVIRWYYLRTARETKRLEAIARSPLFSHITATLQGLTTIRVCHRQDASIERFHTYQDEQTKGWHTCINATRWLAVRVDLISTILIAFVVFLSIPLASSLDAGLVGLSITYSISLTAMCQYTVRSSTEVENLMISAERLMAYGELEPEAPLETPPNKEKPPSSWPSSGHIQLNRMRFKYSNDSPYVLSSITVDIQPQEKVGIVGRTGAGKSSLIQALFRMAEPEGTLKIDGISITEVGLHDLRQRISIIPQDPFLFSGSVRYNLDPFSLYSDEEIWTALEQVKLKAVIWEMDDQLGSSVSEGGSNFSVGQRQLMCLGRALLRKNKILVIDEATANVDMSTDAIIQETIRREFSNCTTLTIAHRLSTIMDADKVMVLKAGKVREFGVPHLLLHNRRGALSRMVEHTGRDESENLRRIAAMKYRNTRK